MLACMVQTFLSHSYGCVPVKFGLLHRISAFLRLVSQRPFRVRPRWHFSVRVNQKKFYLPPTLVKANIWLVKYVPPCVLTSGTGATTLPPPKSYSSRGDNSPMYQFSMIRRSMRFAVAVALLWYLRPPNVSAK